MKSELLVIIPTRDRSKPLFKCLTEAVGNSSGTAQFLILSEEIGDAAFVIAPGIVSTTMVKGPMIEVFSQAVMRCVDDFNIFGMIGDDVWLNTPGWDEKIVEAMSGKVGILYGKDGIQNERLPTHPFFSAEIPKALGHCAAPGAKHYFYDNFFKAIGDRCGFMNYVPELDFEHRHHSIKKSAYDDTYRHTEQFWDNDQKAFDNYVANNLTGDVAKIEAYIKDNGLTKLV